MKKRYGISILVAVMISFTTFGLSSSIPPGDRTDFDPLVDISVTVEIQTIRFLDINELKTRGTTIIFSALIKIVPIHSTYRI